MELPKSWLSWRSISPDDPKRLVKLVREGNKFRNARKALEDQAETLRKEEQALKDYMILNFTKDELKHIETSAGSAHLRWKTVYQPNIQDGGWDKIWKFIIKTKAYDLLQKRLHEGACKERFEAGVKIPGVKVENIPIIKFGDAE